MKKLLIALSTMLFSFSVFAGSQGSMKSGSMSFDKVDSDHNGYIDQVEASAAGISEMTFKKMDTNRNGKVSKKEFKSATKKQTK